MTRKERAAEVLARLRSANPDPQTELRYTNAYELLIAVMLSAQCTDERVNKVTPALYMAYPHVRTLAAAEPEEVFPFIRSVSYPNNKAKHLVAAMRKIVEEHGGEVPRRFEDLVGLPGVGRKTAQVVQSVVFEDAALPVDTHVFRVANRIGLSQKADTPLKVERQLKAVVPRDAWGEAHHLLILHGRYTCTARSPKCDVCPLTDCCRYYAAMAALPPPRKGLDARRGRYYCASRKHYVDSVISSGDKKNEKLTCPLCGSANLFDARTGLTLQRAPDFRIG